jgi:hypothetical protein
MLALYTRYFDNVRRERFLTDLAEKDRVILLRDEGVIVGFSSQRVIDLPVGGRMRHFLSGGDTVVDRAHWREHALAGAFGHLMLRLIEKHGEDDCYWFLATKGHRTYRFLPVFFERFLPGPERPDDPRLRELLNAVASFRYGSAYDPVTGIVRADRDTDRLRPEFAPPPERALADPFVAFFLEKNPRYTAGDDLACLTEIRRDNLNRFGWRVIERTSPTWVD